ncbi:hypothetical protein F4779DRAFT_612638 [Xylariaceae sp. FL0662B]|nr:hypothetical protein F4779DRAFT_612638 [Xylariaceae sp. FL0662B]
MAGLPHHLGYQMNEKQREGSYGFSSGSTQQPPVVGYSKATAQGVFAGSSYIASTSHQHQPNPTAKSLASYTTSPTASYNAQGAQFSEASPGAPSGTPSSSSPEFHAALRARQARRDANYEGRKTGRRAQMRQIPDEENTALWITNLPPDCTVQDILAQIRGIGKVFALHINRPVLNRIPSQSHRNSAASLAFFSPEAAQKMLQKQKAEPLHVGGLKTLVVYNENKVEPCFDYDCSRVLVMEGDPLIVNPGFLTKFLRERGIHWDTDVAYFFEKRNENWIEWHFGSYRGQARQAFKEIKKEFGDRVDITYGRDPCDIS